MYLLFLDESGTPDSSRTDNIFVLGGVIIHESFWEELNHELQSMKIEAGFDENLEIKWRDIRRYHLHEGELKDLSAEEFNRFVDRLYSFPQRGRIKGKLKLVACVVDKALCYFKDPDCDGDKIYQKATYEILSRFQITLYDKMEVNAKGIVLMDERDRNKNRKLRAFIQTVVKKRSRDLPGIIENPILSPSSYSSGIQIADFYIGPIYRNFKTKGYDKELYLKLRENFKIKVGDDTMHGFQLWPYSYNLNKYK